MKYPCDVFINNYICMTEIQLLTTHSTLILLQYQPVFVNSLTVEACEIHTEDYQIKSNEKRFIYLAHLRHVANKLNKTNKPTIIFIAILYHRSRKSIVDWCCPRYCRVIIDFISWYRWEILIRFGYYFIDTGNWLTNKLH